MYRLLGVLDNRQGTVSSQGPITLQVSSLHNHQGHISAQGDVQITTHGQLNNQQGELHSQQRLSVTAEHLDNRSTRASDNQGISGQQLHLEIQQLDNQ